MLIDFHPAHLDELDLTADAAAMPRDAARQLERLAAFGMCRTVAGADGRKILGVVAGVPLSDDTCEVLIVSSVAQKKFPVVFTKGVREALVKIRQHFVNIQAIGEDTPFFTRWFTWLGFSREGLVDRPEFGGTQMRMWRMRGLTV